VVARRKEEKRIRVEVNKFFRNRSTPLTKLKKNLEFELEKRKTTPSDAPFDMPKVVHLLRSSMSIAQRHRSMQSIPRVLRQAAAEEKILQPRGKTRRSATCYKSFTFYKTNRSQPRRRAGQ
jgi:hypothetical protein